MTDLWVVTGEVGATKREIVFHGDVMME